MWCGDFLGRRRPRAGTASGWQGPATPRKTTSLQPEAVPQEILVGMESPFLGYRRPRASVITSLTRSGARWLGSQSLRRRDVG